MYIIVVSGTIIRVPFNQYVGYTGSDINKSMFEHFVKSHKN